MWLRRQASVYVLSQLGILYKLLFPHVFVKGKLKKLVEQAVSSGLLDLAGPAGQQQLHVTKKGRQTGLQQQLQEMVIQPEVAYDAATRAQSPSRQSSLAASCMDEEGDHNTAAAEQKTDPFGNSIVGSSSSDSATIDQKRWQSVKCVDKARTGSDSSKSTKPYVNRSRSASSSSLYHPRLFMAENVVVTTMKKYLQGEKSRHRMYMLHFRVHALQDHSN